MKNLLMTCAFLSVLSFSAVAGPEVALEVGGAAPEFKIKDAAGKEIDLADLTKKGPVLVRLTCGCKGCDLELPVTYGKIALLCNSP